MPSPVPPALVRLGLEQLRALADDKGRADVAARCVAIAAMDDAELTARQHEIAAMRAVGVNAIEQGYYDAAVAVKPGGG